MRLRAILPVVFGLLAATLVACKSDSTSISNSPTHIIVVSGANQVANVSTPVDSPLVVQVLDGANRPVSNIPLTWTVVGGGSVSQTSTTSGSDGKSTVNWTLGPSPIPQVVTVSSGSIAGATVAFVATNGATISGVVTSSTATNPFAATFTRLARRSIGLSTTQRAASRRLSSNRIVIGFKSGSLGVAAAGSATYRTMSVARTTMSALKTRVAALDAIRGLDVAGAEVSPSMVAARIRVTDTAQMAAVMNALRNDPNVAWVERDQIVSIRDGAPRPMSTDFVPQITTNAPAPSKNGVATKLPTDRSYFEEVWPATMLDLPKAWAITTGSASVMVAVVDMGIRFDHADIAANLTNDGYDFVSQVGFGDTEPICPDGSAMPTSFTTIDGDGDGPDPDPTDPDDLEFDDAQGCWVRSTIGDHGLWTSGIIGAVGNDGLGVAGVNWTVKIRPVRVLGITGEGTSFDIAQGILYAAGLPATGAGGALVQAPSRAPIINLSLGGGTSSAVEQAAIDAAANAGSLIVASAGNDGLDLPSFPAAYPNVMAVSAVGMDGQLATYSNAGTYLSVAAPGGDFRLDDNGGGGVIGPGWNFVTGKSTYLFGYGTSASAPYVSGIAALLLAQTPGLTAAQLRSRIEQFATRPTGSTRSDMFGWGIVNAYNALTQQNGPARATIAQLVDATSGAVTRTTKVNADGSFAFTKLVNGAYYVQVGEDENADSTIGVPGRRFAIAGGVGKPTVVNVNGNSTSLPIVLGLPTEVEPNDDVAHANVLTVGSYVIGSITAPDVQDVYSVAIPTAGQYTFETSGVVGSCGMGIELDTRLAVTTSTGTAVGTNDNESFFTGPFCSRVQSASLTPGVYYITVTGTGASQLASHGRYRLQVRAGP